MKKKYSHLLILDVCGTLYNGNSTYDFVWFLAKKKLKIIRYICYFYFARILFLFYPKNIRRYKRRQLIALFFKNMKEDEVRILADKFFLLHFLPKCSFSKIAQYSCPDTKAVIVSASINPPISSLSRHINIGFYSSVLQVSDGFYTGKFTNDILWRKSSVLAQINLRNFKRVTLITDNIEDTDMILMSINRRIPISANIILNNNSVDWEIFFKSNSSPFLTYSFISF